MRYRVNPCLECYFSFFISNKKPRHLGLLSPAAIYSKTRIPRDLFLVKYLNAFLSNPSIRELIIGKILILFYLS